MASALTREKPRRFGGEAPLGIAFVIPMIVIMGGLVQLPLLSTMIDSVYSVSPMRAGTPFVGLKNYTDLFTNSTVNQSWINTFYYVVLAVGLETVGGLATALLLNKVQIGRRWLLAAVVLPWCLPPVVNAVVWMWIYNPSYGLLTGVLHSTGLLSGPALFFNNRYVMLFLVTLVHVWRMMPLTAVIMLAALQSIPKDLYQAARLDGASSFKCFRLITLPLISGGLAIALTQSTVFAFNLFDEAWILNRASVDTRTIIIQVYLDAFQNLKFSLGMALSLMAMLASLLVSLIYVLKVYRETRFD